MTELQLKIKAKLAIMDPIVEDPCNTAILRGTIIIRVIQIVDIPWGPAQTNLTR